MIIYIDSCRELKEPNSNFQKLGSKSQEPRFKNQDSQGLKFKNKIRWTEKPIPISEIKVTGLRYEIS